MHVHLLHGIRVCGCMESELAAMHVHLLHGIRVCGCMESELAAMHVHLLHGIRVCCYGLEPFQKTLTETSIFHKES